MAQIVGATKIDKSNGTSMAMEGDTSHESNNGYAIYNDNDEEEDSHTVMEIINLAETCPSHLGEPSGDLPMDEHETSVVHAFPAHFASGPTNVVVMTSSPPQTSRDLPTAPNA